jgi:anti-anti-sigma regulatory factor
MRKITVEKDANRVVVYARGRLTGSSVSELENCWKNMCSFDTRNPISLDFGGVTSVDKDGKPLLSEMVAKGVQLQADGPMMTSVEKIVSDAPEI